jgi:tetratricopeptide (TPR) repeat protein
MARFAQILCLLYLMTAVQMYTFSQDLNSMIKEGDRLEAIPNEKAALHQFKEVLKIQPVNLYALCKSSELCSRIAGRETSVQLKDSYNQAAIIYGKTALKLYPNSDEANVAVAIAVGRTLLKKSGKEKVSIVKEIKEYIDIALKVNPNNFKAWHVLGKWNYEIYNLSGIERAMVKIFYGGLPEGSLNNSITAYEKARVLNPQFALNYLELARAYHKRGDNEKAISLLKYMMQLPIQTEDDPRIKKEAVGLIENWK